jgi:2-polyprenyl-3-methyl-5-hydroxy-6-metoxy-1,4-benzoquinol methylase
MTIHYDQAIPESTSRNTHNVVSDLLAEEPEIKTVLDAPCGAGAFTKRMLDRGLNVCSIDCEDLMQAPRGRFMLADMSEALPFAEGVFDAVVCIDGIEHIERPFDFIGECRRVTRKGGVLVISTPNLSALRSRWRWLMTGFHQGEKIPLDESRRGPSQHVSLVSFPELRFRLHTRGFRVTAVRTNRVMAVSWLYAPLLPFTYLMTRWVFYKEGRRLPSYGQNREILRQLFSTPILFGETLIVKAVRL